MKADSFVNKAEKSQREKLARMIHISVYPDYEYSEPSTQEVCPLDQSIVASHNLGFNGRPSNVITTLMHARAVGDIATEMAMERRLKTITEERDVPSGASDSDIRQAMSEFIPAYAQTPYEYQQVAEKHGLDTLRKQYLERREKAMAEHRKLFAQFRQQVISFSENKPSDSNSE